MYDIYDGDRCCHVTPFINGQDHGEASVRDGDCYRVTLLSPGPFAWVIARSTSAGSRAVVPFCQR